MNDLENYIKDLIDAIDCIDLKAPAKYAAKALTCIPEILDRIEELEELTKEQAIDLDNLESEKSILEQELEDVQESKDKLEDELSEKQDEIKVLELENQRLKEVLRKHLGETIE